MATPQSLEVLADARQVAALLPPLRRKILETLAAPDSASGLARRLGESRQKINYHLRELEREGLVELVEERPRRGCVERVLRPTARAFLVSPALLGALGTSPKKMRDRFSSAYLIAAAAATVRDVATLRERASAAGKTLPTMTVQVDVGFASPAELTAFTDELNEAVAKLTKKYHRSGQGSRRYRFLIGAHPVITKTAKQAARAAARTTGTGRKEKKS